MIGLSAGRLDWATYLTSCYFGARHYGSIFAVVFCFFTIGYTAGPLAAARVRDVMGGYSLVLIAIVAALPASAFLVATLGPYPDRRVA